MKNICSSNINKNINKYMLLISDELFISTTFYKKEHNYVFT